MKVALVYDHLTQFGGAERVLQALASLWPDAPIYTTVYDEQGTGGVFAGRVIRTSFIQSLPLATRYPHAYTPLLPLAVEGWDFSSFDAVISIAGPFAKGIITRPHTRHIAYCLTPPRFLWEGSHAFWKHLGYPAITRAAVAPIQAYIRLWDAHAAQRATDMVAISRTVAERIEAYWKRSAPIIYPPVRTDVFYPVQNARRDVFLAAGRLVSYKRFDIAIRAARAAGVPLVIVGDGPERARLERLAQGAVTFVGRVSDDELRDLYAHAQALVFPQEEDFGIVPVEAMACGTPVIAYARGGAAETVLDGVTGTLVHEQSVEAFASALHTFRGETYTPEACRKRAEQFSTSVFLSRIQALFRD
ncbi:MAG: glycosyltransferase [Candidatus Paceibacterota bacterium]|nr:MAG: glycosyltransferase [Candidatus Paceibacterota bacterium]